MGNNSRVTLRYINAWVGHHAQFNAVRGRVRPELCHVHGRVWPGVRRKRVTSIKIMALQEIIITKHVKQRVNRQQEGQYRAEIDTQTQLQRPPDSIEDLQCHDNGADDKIKEIQRKFSVFEIGRGREQKKRRTRRHNPRPKRDWDKRRTTPYVMTSVPFGVTPT